MQALQLINIEPDELVERIVQQLFQLLKPKEEEVWITQKEASKITGKTAKTIKNWEGIKVTVKRLDKTDPMYLKSDVLKHVKQ